MPLKDADEMAESVDPEEQFDLDLHFGLLSPSVPILFHGIRIYVVCLELHFVPGPICICCERTVKDLVRLRVCAG